MILDESDFWEWLEDLGLPRVADDTFADVYPFGDQVVDANASKLKFSAFIVSEDAKKVAILDPHLVVSSYNKDPASSFKHKTISYRLADLSSYVDEKIRYYNDLKGNRLLNLEPIGLPVPNLVFLSYACKCSGADRNASVCLTLARAFAADMDGQLASFEVLRNKIGTQIYWNIFQMFDDGFISRAEIANAVDQFIVRFPAHDQATKAREMHANLSRMIKEDAEHSTRKRPPSDSSVDRIDELIFLLRDQHGIQSSCPGKCDILDKSLDGPAKELLQIGETARPKLRAIIDDTRLSRAVECRQFTCFSHRVLTIGECARQILSAQ
ncbi:hypothetical protein K2X85_01375 [bacterium]|nr:hypothetical protein [bacterium]